MANFVNHHDFNEMLVQETAIIMLRKPEPDLAYGDEASWHFIETVLTGKNDKKACIHFLKSEAAPLARLGAECIKVGSERSWDFCSLLCEKQETQPQETATTELPESTMATTFFEKIMAGTKRRGTSDQ